MEHHRGDSSGDGTTREAKQTTTRVVWRHGDNGSVPANLGNQTHERLCGVTTSATKLFKDVIRVGKVQIIKNAGVENFDNEQVATMDDVMTLRDQARLREHLTQMVPQGKKTIDSQYVNYEDGKLLRDRKRFGVRCASRKRFDTVFDDVRRDRVEDYPTLSMDARGCDTLTGVN